MTAIEQDRRPTEPRVASDTGEAEALYGAGIGALVGVLISIFTSAGIGPAVFACALYGVMLGGGVSLVKTFRYAKHIARSRGSA